MKPTFLVPFVATGWPAFVAFDLLFKFLSVAIFTPLSAVFLRAVLQWSGDQVVSNYDLIGFLLSLQGLLLVVGWGTGAFAVQFFELGGLVMIAIGLRGRQPVSAVGSLRVLWSRFPSLLAIAFRQFLFLGAIVAVVVAVAGVTKATVLGGGDIYFYLQVRPPQYWWALGIVGTAATAGGLWIVTLLFQWIFAVPLLLLEDRNAREAMAESAHLVRKVGVGRIIVQLAGWAALMILFLFLGCVVHELLRRTLMAIASNRVNLVFAMAGLLLAMDFLLSLVLGLVAAISFASIVARLYNGVRPETRLPTLLIAQNDSVRRPKHISIGLSVFAGAAALLGTSAVLAHAIVDQIRLDDAVAVTAHRGSSLAAPENTMAAIRQAVEDGADYAEIDVQETADSVVVLLHDTDLRRVAGIDRGAWELTYKEMKDLDIGSWFSKDFSDERIVTLERAIEAARGRIKLNIELKLHGHNRRLETEVTRIIRQAAFEHECIVTSLRYAVIQRLGRQDGRLRRGLIVTAKVGDATKLDVDILSVNAQSVTRDLVTRAHRAGKEVHVWTVNRPEQMLTMIHMGVDNIITSSPDVLVELLREREKLSDVERTLLFVSDLLAGRL